MPLGSMGDSEHDIGFARIKSTAASSAAITVFASRIPVKDELVLDWDLLPR